MNKKSLNYKVLLIFAPILVLIGVSGFVIPADKALTSGAPAYNVFHLLFGAIGLLLLYLKNENVIRLFNIGFGALDAYQAVASFTNLFPVNYFQWTRADDGLHVVIGLALIAIGVYGFAADRSKPLPVN